MNTRDIDLKALSPRGRVLTETRDGAFWMTVPCSNTLDHCRLGIKCAHYAEVPGRFRLPLRIDVTAKIDVPSFFIMLGEGHANFGTFWSDNRRLDDICEPHHKPVFFDNRVAMGEYADISLIYDLKEMQILIGGGERYYSKKEKYMKSPVFGAMNEEGFPLRISCVKRAELSVKAIRVTEYDGTAGIIRPPAAEDNQPAARSGGVYEGKPSFEDCVANLPAEVRGEITALDKWLRELRPVKFKRQIEKHGNKITYVAPEQGFSYAIHPSYDVMYHTLQWYFLAQGKPETWGRRKPDRMEDTLNCLAQTDPAFARRMFDNLFECVGSPGCLARTPYTFEGEKKVSCHGRMFFTMNFSEFGDVRRFIGALNEISRE